MNITLGAEQEQFIREQLAHGQFQSAEEVIVIALQLLEEQQQDYQVWVGDVRDKVNEAAEELARREGIPLDVVVDRIQEKFREAREDQKR
jgi:antitoxin ParD1/3/4